MLGGLLSSYACYTLNLLADRTMGALIKFRKKIYKLLFSYKCSKKTLYFNWCVACWSIKVSVESINWGLRSFGKYKLGILRYNLRWLYILASFWKSPYKASYTGCRYTEKVSWAVFIILNVKGYRFWDLPLQKEYKQLIRNVDVHLTRFLRHYSVYDFNCLLHRHLYCVVFVFLFN